MFRSTWLIARSVLIEAIRRREIYAIVLVTLLMIGAALTLDFFNMTGLEKFYREVSLKVMSAATALTVVVLAARQLPREFRNRTIYPMMAKPVSRVTFLLGKLAGVVLAGAFCFALFMLVYVGGALYLGQSIPWGLFLQYVWLQLWMLGLLAALCFWLSLLFNLDAAITIGVIFYLVSSTINNLISELYDFSGPAAKGMLLGLNYLLPNLTLFDLSEKAVHAGDVWGPVSAGVLLAVTAYGLFWVAVYFGLAMISFRRKPL